MRKLPKPTINTEFAFNACISGVSDNVLKSKFEGCKDLVITASDQYELLAEITQLHTITDNLCSINTVSKEEMKKLYTQWMVPSKTPGRAIYEEIFKTPRELVQFVVIER